MTSTLLRTGWFRGRSRRHGGGRPGGRPRPALWPVVAGVVTVFVVALCILSSSPTAASQDEAEAALYAQQCASCHGAEGEGGIGPDLRGLTSAADVAAQVRAG
ncbi:MAG: hypothetical protein EHM52_05465, partial [Actinomycetota bacterium]